MNIAGVQIPPQPHTIETWLILWLQRITWFFSTQLSSPCHLVAFFKIFFIFGINVNMFTLEIHNLGYLKLVIPNKYGNLFLSVRCNSDFCGLHKNTQLTCRHVEHRCCVYFLAGHPQELKYNHNTRLLLPIAVLFFSSFFRKCPPPNFIIKQSVLQSSHRSHISAAITAYQLRFMW